MLKLEQAGPAVELPPDARLAVTEHGHVFVVAPGHPPCLLSGDKLVPIRLHPDE